MAKDRLFKIPLIGVFEKVKIDGGFKLRLQFKWNARAKYKK